MRSLTLLTTAFLAFACGGDSSTDALQDGDVACSNDQMCPATHYCSGVKCVEYPPAPTCGGQSVSVSELPANMHILLDRSGSMGDKIKVDGVDRTLWSIATQTVRSTTSALGADLQFGLQLYPGNTRCQVGEVLVQPGTANAAAAIDKALPAKESSPGDNLATPIAAALKAAQSLKALEDTTRTHSVLVITDGEENCNGDPAKEARALLAKGIKTYVVGFGSGVSKNQLDAMAVAGGTARAGGTKYYQADNAEALDKALAEIGAGAAGCDFALATVPPDPTNITVFIGEAKSPRDATKTNGWEYDAGSKSIRFYGTACTTLQTTQGAKVNVEYGCKVEIG